MYIGLREKDPLFFANF